jgi:hypothetical protein
MEKKLFFYGGLLLALTAGCMSNNGGSEDSSKTDPADQTRIVQKATSVDTAAIIAKYEADKAKTRETYKATPKKTGNKEVTVEPAAPAEKAQYPGGEKAFYDYLGKNLEYPRKALDHNVEGTVYADIFLDEKGKITKVEFNAKELGYGLEDEVRRVLLTAPAWIPASEGGKNVKSVLTLPISFKIK